MSRDRYPEGHALAGYPMADIGAADTVTRAWRVALPDATVQIAGWLLDAPWAHPVWAGHYLTIVHLRPMVGAEPARLRYPEAEYELAVFALDPSKGRDVVNPDDGATVARAILNGSHVNVQFHGKTDAEVVALAEVLVREVVACRLSPDVDHQRRWERLIAASGAATENGYDARLATGEA